MRQFSRSFSAPREQEQMDEQTLVFRNLTHLFPPSDVIDRARKHVRGSETDAAQKTTPTMFDEDADKQSPLAASEDIRIMIAQDEAGMSMNRLLFDSKVDRDSKRTDSDHSGHRPRVLSFSRPASQSESKQGSGFVRYQSPGESRIRPNTTPSNPDRLHSPSSQSAFCGQPTPLQRMPAYVSLADARNDPEIPVEDTKDEMDSWLDCVFGRSPLRYKGSTTKVHMIQRQPKDPKLAHWEREAQRGGFELCPQRNAPLPKSPHTELVQLRKPALLVSRVFAVPIHDEDLPQQSRAKTPAQPTQSDGQTKGPSRIRYGSPLFGVAILLPLVKPKAGEQESDSAIQLVIDRWHIIARALDSLEALAARQILRKLSDEISLLAQRFPDGSAPAYGMVKLKPRTLQESASIIQLSESVASRISRNFHIFDVVVRGEWNIWRDGLRESTKTPKNLLDTSQIRFAQLAITAALSSNRCWLRKFAPLYLQASINGEHRDQQDTYDAAQDRTVLVTTDHNKARQMIYLLGKLTTSPQSSALFQRSPTRKNRESHISALTQGLKAAERPDGSNSPNGYALGSGITSATPGIPLFSLPTPSPLSSSPVKYPPTMGAVMDASPGLQRLKSRIEVHTKATPAVPISSAPVSSYTTPAGSPDVRPGSSSSAQGDLLRHLQRGNSAISETSTESGSLWNSLRSSSWSWKVRRESGVTSGSDNGAGNSVSHRGDPPIGTLKSSKGSLGPGVGKKPLKMVDEAQQAQATPSTLTARNDSIMPTPTFSSSMSSRRGSSPFPNVLAYTYDASASVIDVQLPGEKTGLKYCKVPVSANQFPHMGNEQGVSSSDNPSEQSSRGHAAYDRVAGYLETFHPDYALQAVKTYSDLERDVRGAMQSEPSPKHKIAHMESRSFPLERWAVVCSTVIIDVDTMAVKRLTLRRNIRYSLIVPKEASGIRSNDMSVHGIKVTKSDEMDTVKRTYKRNDAGNKVDWKDKKVLRSDNGHSGGSTGSSMTSSYEHIDSASTGSTVRQQLAASQATATKNANSAPATQSKPAGNAKRATGSIGDDLTAYIDPNAKKSHLNNTDAAITVTRRVAVRNNEGKITGWKEVDVDEPDEPGLNDLPASFLNSKRERPMPVIYERVLEEVFEEEALTKSDPAIVALVEQMLADNSPRSAAPSRSSSAHGCTHSRSNSMNGSRLGELQKECQNIVEKTLEELVAAAAVDKGSPTKPPSGLFSFRRATQSAEETSVLRQSISKWLSKG